MFYRFLFMIVFGMLLFWQSDCSLAQSSEKGSTDTQQGQTQQPLQGQSQPSAQESMVVASVGQHSITAGVINRFIKSRFANHPLVRNADPNDLSPLQAEATQHFVRRALVYHYLVSKKSWLTPQQIQLKLDSVDKKLGRVGSTIDSYAAEQGVTRAEIEFETAWQFSWKRFLERTLTEEKLKNFYTNNRRQYDGTKLQVAHLLLKAGPENNATANTADKAVLEKAKQLHQQLVAAPDQWPALTQQHSEAPSKAESGLVGWIGINGPMPTAFSKAAFELKKGEFSKPVQTSFGWHIIRCLDEKPGKLGLKDARDEVYAGATKVIFDRLVDLERDKQTIVYAKNWPHFDKQGKLVSPAQSPAQSPKNR